MATSETLNKVSALLRRWIDAEQECNWSFVRRVPSTYTWKEVDYLRALQSAERRESLFEALVSSALFGFDSLRDSKLHPGSSRHAEFCAMIDAMPMTCSWEYEDVRALRALLAERQPGGTSSAAVHIPSEVLQRAQAIRPTNSREIRAAVKKAFSSRFSAQPRKAGGGDWRYAGVLGEQEFVVTIDYGGSDQLRYEVDYRDLQTDLEVKGVNYERLVGAGLGHWDYLTADNLAESVELLCELVEKVVKLPECLEGERAAEQGVGPDDRSPSAPARRSTP